MTRRSDCCGACPGAVVAVLAVAAALAGVGSAATLRADPASDAPEGPAFTARPAAAHPSYALALAAWRTPEELNDWIGANFVYDQARALALSETQRAARPGPPIHEPAAFFARPTGVCVDLARFAVDTLRRIAPELAPAYLMIEFRPASLSGNVLRRHWVARFERGGALYFFADSKRPGVIAGPYASVEAFVADYAAYRGREIVAYREASSFQRQAKATRQRGREGS